MVANDFKKATLAQLAQIMKEENCPLIYKGLAEWEMDKRILESGLKATTEF